MSDQQIGIDAATHIGILERKLAQAQSEAIQWEAAAATLHKQYTDIVEELRQTRLNATDAPAD